ncbi:MAG: hemolysin family protein [Dehalococcoidia bacterium]
MSADGWIGIVLLAMALVVLVVATAAEAGVVLSSRARVHAFASKGLPQAAPLDAFIQERPALLGALAVAKGAAVVLGIAVATFLVLRATEQTWLALGLTMVVALVALVVVEAVPRLAVARSPERWSLRLVPAIRVLRLLFGVPARLLDVTFQALLRGRSGERKEEAEEEDIDLLRLVELHEGNGGVENGELAMIRRIANMVDRAVREIMVPRIDMVSCEAAASLEDVLRLVTERGYSRIPVYEETIDNIIGVVYAKDVLKRLADGQRQMSVREMARPPYFVPEGKHIDELLADLQANKVHIAIVVDEYGGTAGLVTIEDVLEEIVGEIQDEYDREEATVQSLNDSEAILDAKVSLDELNELFDLAIEGEDFDTVGGYVYHQLGRMPDPGDEVQVDGLTLRVLSTLGRRIKKIRVTKQAVAAGHRREEPAS